MSDNVISLSKKREEKENLEMLEDLSDEETMSFDDIMRANKLKADKLYKERMEKNQKVLMTLKTKKRK